MVWVADYIVVFNELLLFSYHIFQIDDCPCLQLQIQKQLHVLTLQEVVLDDQLQVVLDVVILNAGLDGVPDVSNLLIIIV